MRHHLRRGGALSALALISTVFVIGLAAPPAQAAPGPNPVLTMYVPMFEDDYMEALRSIDTGAPNPIGTTARTTISITASAPNTVIYYDQWENGFEGTINDPLQTTGGGRTVVWGDGNTSNGDVGLFCTRCAAAGTDVIPAGGVITLNNTLLPDGSGAIATAPGPVTTPRVSSTVYWDGRDKIASTRALTVSQAGWGQANALASGAVSAFDTSRWGNQYVVPIGQDSAFIGGSDPSEYTALMVMAKEANTHILIDGNDDGDYVDAIDRDVYRNEGETVFVDGGILEGATVLTSKPVQADMFVGDIDADYEVSALELIPSGQQANSYLIPAATYSANYETVVYLYNPNASAITVSTQTSSGTTNTNVPAGVSVPIELNAPIGGAAVISSTSPFFTQALIGASSGNGGSADASADYDWGFAPVPTSYLTPTVVVGWAPGSQDGTDTNASAVWISSQTAATVYVDFDGDPTTGSNFYPSSTLCSSSEQYDVAISIAALESRRIVDTDGDMTGARITTCDFAKPIAAAYGEDPANAPTGFPGLDLGTAIFPASSLINAKSVALWNDDDGDGEADPGDVLEWSLQLSGGGATTLTNIVIADNLPPGVTYDFGTTSVDLVPVADNIVPPSATEFPLDEGGIGLGSLAPGASTTIRFRTVIDDPFTLPSGVISNSACGDSDQSVTCSIGEIPVEQPAGISDRVWIDLDGDGIQDAVEVVGVVGVRVNLYLDANGDGTPDGGVITFTGTDSNGLYSFTGLDPTPNYIVEFVRPDARPFSPANQGANDNVDSDANVSTGRTGTLDVVGGQTRTDVDAGLQPTATISDFVWTDTNSNGQQNVGEPGIDGVTVRLYASTDLVTPIALTTTAGGGLYNFSGLDPSINYVVEFVNPGGRLFTTADTGSDTTDSDANTTTGRTGTINPAPGQVITNVDAGFLPPAITIDKVSDAGADVAPGDTLTYTITVNNPGPGTLNNVIVTDTLPTGLTWQSTSVQAPVSTTVGNYADDFESNGYAGSTGATAWSGDWIETDDSGTAPVQDTGDVRNTSNLTSRRLHFQKGNDTGLESIARVAGDLSGASAVTVSWDWRCQSMENGDIMNVEIRPNGSAAWQPIAQYANGADCDTAAFDNDAVTLTSGQWGTATEIRFRQSGSWAGGSNDQFRADNVTITGTTRSTSTYAGSAPSTLTTIPNLLNGESATITVVTVVDDPLSTSVVDFDNTATADPDETPPVSDDVVDPVAPGVISNYVWVDLDGDGIQDGSESGVNGVTVELYDSTGTTLLQTTTTAGAGNYAFTVPAGTYVVKFVPLAGSVLTAPNRGGDDNLDSDANPFSGFTGGITVAAAEVRTDIDAGITLPGSIGDTVYVDLDGDGTQDPPETTGVPNVDIDLTYDLDGDGTCDTVVLQSATTNGSGTYNFTNLPPGTWCVELDETTLPPSATVTSPNPVTHLLTPNETYLNADFGIELPAVISDRVWIDIDADGIQDPSEAGLDGVTVELYDSTGTNLLQSTTTAGGGLYSFTVAPGTYVVIFDQPSGYDFSPQDQGGNDALDSDANPTTGATAQITVTSGQTRTDVDAGVYDPSGLGSIGDTVFYDANGNGSFDTGEGLAGVEVTVTWAGPDGNLATAGDNQDYVVTTGPGGTYLADLLPAGNYSVTVNTATLPSGLTTNTVDPNGGNDSTSTLALAAGEDRLDQDFGYVGAGSIGDTIFHDVNDNGSPDGGEGLAGVDVTVTWAGVDGDINTAGDNVSITTTTGAGGTYLVSGLPAGTFTVTVDTADLPSALTINSVDPDGGSDSTSTLTLVPLGSNLDQDFGYRRPNSPPVALIDDASVCANTPISISVLANDSDADLDTLTLVSVSTSAAGRTPTIAGSDISYSPPSNFTGVDVFTYVVTDGYGATTTGTVTVTVGSCGLVANDRMYFIGLGGDTGPGPGPGYYDRIVSVNQLRFSGQQLVIRLRDGFVPQPGDTFDIWTAPAMSGHFAKIYGRVMPNGVVLQVKILPDRVRLVAVRGHRVTDDGDVVDANVGDGTCATADGVCTLRAAVQESNALAGPDGIVGLANQTTDLAISGAEENLAATGDLDITGDTTLVGQGSIVDANDLDRSLHVTATGALDANDLTLRDGIAYGVVPGAGAVFNDGGALTLTDVVLTDNEGLIGGGLGTVGGTTTLNRGVITGNRAAYGGGVGAFGPTVLDAVLVEGNDASAGGGGIGVSPAASVTAREATIRDNDAVQGGGIGVFGGGSATLTRTAVTGNRATSVGGGVYAEGSVTIADARVSANLAPNGAGLRTGTTTAIDRTTIDANVASVRGGAIENFGSLSLTAVTIDANVAPDGAALAQVAGSATLVSVTAVAQRATGVGGGALLDTSGTPLSLMNSIVSDNVAGAACSTSIVGLTSGGWNHIGDASCGLSGTADVNGGTAGLGPLTINGGYAPTHKPGAGAPVTNTGATSGCGAKDQRNYPRPRGGACEKGAIEL